MKVSKHAIFLKQAVFISCIHSYGSLNPVLGDVSPWETGGPPWRSSARRNDVAPWMISPWSRYLPLCTSKRIERVGRETRNMCADVLDPQNTRPRLTVAWHFLGSYLASPFLIPFSNSQISITLPTSPCAHQHCTLKRVTEGSICIHLKQ